MENLSTDSGTAWETMELPSLSTLPYIVPSWQKPSLLKYKKLAIEKEKLLKEKNEKRLRKLREYVNNKLHELKAKQTVPSNLAISEMHESSTTKVNVRPSGEYQLPLATHHTNIWNFEEGNLQSEVMISQDPWQTAREPYTAINSWQHTPENVKPCTFGISTKSSSVGNYGNIERPLTGKLLERWRYTKMAAIVKGFLTKKLYQSDKVQHLRKTVKDAESVLATLPDLSATVNKKDLQLKERVTAQHCLAQLLAAKIALYEIFFELPPRDQMVYIAHTRAAKQEKRRQHIRPFTVPNEEIKKKPSGRLSAATLKVMERKKQSPAPSSNIHIHKKTTPQPRYN